MDFGIVVGNFDICMQLSTKWDTKNSCQEKAQPQK
jgi:hypothetical protein